jgi:hypothetical protein
VVADQPLALADELGHLRRVAVFLDETPVRVRFLERAEVGADHVLGHDERQRFALDLAHLRVNLAELRGLRRTVAALPGDDCVAAVAVAGKRQGAMIPCRFTDSISSAIRSSSNSARGFALLGRICASVTMLSVAVMIGSLLP